MHSRRSEFLAGLRAELPLALGVVPFGMIYGALAIEAGLDWLPAQLMSCIVFAGSSQLIGTRNFREGAPSPVIILTTFVVNLRHGLYSLALAPDLSHLPRRWRILLGYLLTDEAYAGAVNRFANRADPALHRHWFLFATGLLLWTSWQVATAAGIALGTSVPAEWQLDFTLALTFLGIVVPAIRDRAGLAAAVSAAAVAVIAIEMPYRLGLVVAACTGIAVGLALSGHEPVNPVVTPGEPR